MVSRATLSGPRSRRGRVGPDRGAHGAAGGDVRGALAAWERRQLTLGRDLLTRCRQIGDSSQFLGAFRPGDRRLIFGLYGPGH